MTHLLFHTDDGVGNKAEHQQGDESEGVSHSGTA